MQQNATWLLALAQVFVLKPQNCYFEASEKTYFLKVKPTLVICSSHLIDWVEWWENELKLHCPQERLLHLSLLPACPTANHLVTHVCADLLLDWSLAAKWARLLITHLAAVHPTHQRSKHDGG